MAGSITNRMPAAHSLKKIRFQGKGVVFTHLPAVMDCHIWWPGCSQDMVLLNTGNAISVYFLT
jgi:hypothetical protein